jgi:hypothetical protein
MLKNLQEIIYQENTMTRDFETKEELRQWLLETFPNDPIEEEEVHEMFFSQDMYREFVI